MDQIVVIFKQLGVDETIGHQFIVFVIMFALLKVLLFDKLQFVLELREAKTTKLDGDADAKFGQADRMANEYEEKMKAINSQAMNHIYEVKGKALNKQKVEIKKVEDQLDDQIESKRQEFMKEIDVKKGEILKSADQLSDGLVQKLIQ
ncbi:MAG: hypothetical protein CME71_02405 [Halobacteriovorax sp.]|nr:hypothetical protein [Halobacteriovorax sp.]